MYDHEELKRQLRQPIPTYKEFINSLDWDDKGRCCLGGYDRLLGIGRNNTSYLQRKGKFIFFINELERDGYIIQSIDISDNVFIISNRLYIYKPNKRFQAWVDRNHWKLFWAFVIGTLLISIAAGAGAFFYFHG